MKASTKKKQVTRRDLFVELSEGMSVLKKSRGIKRTRRTTGGKTQAVRGEHVGRE